MVQRNSVVLMVYLRAVVELLFAFGSGFRVTQGFSPSVASGAFYS